MRLSFKRTLEISLGAVETVISVFSARIWHSPGIVLSIWWMFPCKETTTPRPISTVMRCCVPIHTLTTANHQIVGNFPQSPRSMVKISRVSEEMPCMPTDSFPMKGSTGIAISLLSKNGLFRQGGIFKTLVISRTKHHRRVRQRNIKDMAEHCNSQL